MIEGEGSGPSLLALAAGGDRDALALFRDELVAEANGEESQSRHSYLIAQAEVFAGLTAAHGHPADRACLASIAIWRARQACDGSKRPAYGIISQAFDGAQTSSDGLTLDQPSPTLGQPLKLVGGAGI